MSTLDTISYYYNKNDPRTSEWFLISRPGTLITILLFYVYFCVSLGPKLMSTQKAYTLRSTLVVYNFIQVLLSIYIVYEALMAGWLYEYSWTCQPIDYSYDPLAMRMARVGRVYFICKLIELLDTVFFVLRKKDRQISFLHLYHHTSMPLLAWYGVRYVAGGQGSLFLLINSFVHIIMYAYYLLAALGPEVQKYLWWKKYLTLLQLIQFAIVGSHGAIALLNDCNYPKTLSVLIVVEAIIFIYMFGSFYIKNNMTKDVRKANPGRVSDSSRSSLKSD